MEDKFLAKVIVQTADGKMKDPTDIGVKAENVVFPNGTYLPEQLEHKVNKSFYEEKILRADKWDKIKKIYSLESSDDPQEKVYSNRDYDIELGFGPKTTPEQIEAFLRAQIVDNPQQNILMAKGILPTEDINILLKVVKK